MRPPLNRREALKACGIAAATVVFPGWRIEVFGAQAKLPEIRINNNYTRGQWFFDPVGLHVQKGQRVRWFATKWGATITAFHPANNNHELRIPRNAKPFDSGLLGEDSPRFNAFEWTFDVEGTYDYFSKNHEPLGMVGRIVVGSPGGPAEEFPPGYGGREGRAPVFPAQARLLMAIPSSDIVSKGPIAYPRDLIVRSFPYGEVR
jgi:plastocyanin